MRLTDMITSVDQMNILDVFAVLLPEPTTDEIRHEMQKDVMKNPHNEFGKPKRRDEIEIKCELRYKYALALMQQRYKLRKETESKEYKNTFYRESRS